MDAHPIPESSPDFTIEERVRYLELYLARLWNQVWWMNLPAHKRAAYEAEGFTAPILNFYERL